MSDQVFAETVKVFPLVAEIDACVKGHGPAVHLTCESGGALSVIVLTAADRAQGDGLGRFVSVDGNTLVAGANARSFNTGAAYVFLRSGTSWSQQAELTASDGQESYQFAFSVLVSGDTVTVGAPIWSNGTGAGYFFVRAGTNWTEQAEVGASDAANPDLFGWSSSLSADTAVVGALFKGNFRGAAYVFVRSAAGWAQQAKLTASDAVPGAQFGDAVAVDGDTAVITAPGTASAEGSAYVFVRSGTNWTQQAKLTASDGAANNYFGLSVSVNGTERLRANAFRLM